MSGCDVWHHAVPLTVELIAGFLQARPKSSTLSGVVAWSVAADAAGGLFWGLGISFWFYWVGTALKPRFLLRWEALSVRLSGTTQRAAVQEPSFASLGSGYLLLPLTLR